MLPKTGTVFHSLKLLSYCGSGAYGDVFYCQDLSGRKLAVKIISKQKLGSHWERELRGVINYRRITEDNAGLLKIHSVGEDEETFFYTMDAADSTDSASYVPDTLAARLKKGTLPENEIFPILSELFAGIRTIHQAGLVHRDIKPENILFVKGKPKIGDIGLLVSLSETMTQAAGTLGYLPPEERSADNASENAGKLNQDNDLYAFGKVIYSSCYADSEIFYSPFLPPLRQISRQTPCIHRGNRPQNERDQTETDVRGNKEGSNPFPAEVRGKRSPGNRSLCKGSVPETLADFASADSGSRRKHLVFPAGTAFRHHSAEKQKLFQRGSEPVDANSLSMGSHEYRHDEEAYRRNQG